MVSKAAPMQAEVSTLRCRESPTNLERKILARVASSWHPMSSACSPRDAGLGPVISRTSFPGSPPLQDSSASERPDCKDPESSILNGVSDQGGTGVGVGSAVGEISNVVGVFVGLSVGVGVAFGSGEFAATGVAAAMLAGAAISVGSGAGVFPVQAIMAASVNRSRAMTGRRGFGI